MNGNSWMLSDHDLSLIIRVVIPELKDKERMVRILREDEDILEGMLRDDRLFKYLLDDPESIIKVSPYLLFTVLLHRAKHELENQSYTVERDKRSQMAVFDVGKVMHLMNERTVLIYLANMLVSFVKINSFTIPVRIRKGMWHKLKFSDFDIDSLIRFSQMIEEDHRFGPYKRIADICLFVTGIFPDYIGSHYEELMGGITRTTRSSEWNREGFEEHGKYFYRAAARHKAAQDLELHQVLQQLSENFILATKPLSFLSSHYLGFFKKKLFLL
jgi:hypothetical protein